MKAPDLKTRESSNSFQVQKPATSASFASQVRDSLSEAAGSNQICHLFAEFSITQRYSCVEVGDMALPKLERLKEN